MRTIPFNREDFDKIREEIAITKSALTYLKAKHHVCYGSLAKNKFLYFIQCGDAIKIGVSSDPEQRLSVLATGAPGHLSLLAMIPKSGHLESQCHKKLSHLRLHGEWFRYTEEVDLLIKELI